MKGRRSVKYIFDQMKKFSTKAIFLTTVGVILPVLAFAQGGVTPITPPQDVNVVSLIDRVVNFAFGLLIIIAGVMIFYAAYLYLFAGQTPDNTKKAKSLIIYALVAIVVAFLAKGLVTIVRGLLQI